MGLKEILETLIFISGRTLGTSEMIEILSEVPDGPRPTRQDLQRALEELEREWGERGGGLRIVRVAEGYEFRSDPSYAPWIRAMNKPKPQRLSLPAVETVSLIAYRQPVTRSEIESVRSVDSGAVLKSLLERRLIRIVGRKEEPGRPILYATSREFLEFFGLKDLSELPPLKEFEEMVRSQMADVAGSAEELSVEDLVSSPEEVEAMAKGDREAIEGLEQTLKDLKETEKAVLSSNDPSQSEKPQPDG